MSIELIITADQKGPMLQRSSANVGHMVLGVLGKTDVLVLLRLDRIPLHVHVRACSVIVLPRSKGEYKMASLVASSSSRPPMTWHVVFVSLLVEKSVTKSSHRHGRSPCRHSIVTVTPVWVSPWLVWFSNGCGVSGTIQAAKFVIS